ncbi:MAG TPA: F0F1 ATP synthase subunit delta [Chloroflexia bacterium]|nr:F0F1 ATP synthase subunit delta [Chloroflexia bacterium]
MAIRGAAARRYAQAIFEIARDTNTLDKWLSDLKTLNSIFGNDNAVDTLDDPRLTGDNQRKIIAEHLPKGTVSELAENMLQLLVQRDRLSLLPRIVQLFQEMYNKEKGIVIAHVTTAVPLDEAHKRSVAEQISRMSGGKQVELRLTEDPRILGGIITRIGDELIDASVASRLADLQERLS